MLDSQIVYGAGDLAAVLVGQGKTLSPKGGTILNRLSQTTRSPGQGDLTGITTDPESGNTRSLDQYFFASLIENSTDNLADGSENEHSALMVTLSKQIADSVSGTINFTRNVVNPLIKSICAEITEVLDNAGRGGYVVECSGGSRFLLTNGSLVVNIIEDGPEDIFFDATIEKEIDSRLRENFKDLHSPNLFPEMTSEELYSYMRETKSPFVNDVLDYLQKSENGYELLIDVYNTSYHLVPGQVRGVTINNLRGDLTIGTLINLAIGLCLADDLPAGTYGSANEAENRVVDWISQLKNIISISLESYKNALKTKDMVLHSYKNNCEINVNVNREIYKSFLADGGSVEALIGAVVTDKNYDYDSLLSDREKYEEAYEKRCLEAATYANNNRLALFKNTLYKMVYQAIFEPGDAIRPVPKQQAREALDREIDLTFIDALECPHETVRRVVCRSIFEGTDAEQILVNIDELSKVESDLDVREISGLVVLDYVTSYLVSQMDIKKD